MELNKGINHNPFPDEKYGWGHYIRTPWVPDLHPRSLECPRRVPLDARYISFNYEDRETCCTSYCKYFPRQIHLCTLNTL